MANEVSKVRWLQVWSLASVQGAISLTWIAYGIYLPKFIEQVFEYPTDRARQLATLIFVIESAIAVIIEPVFGGLSDRWQRWYGSRMPLIGAGTIASTVIFMALPSTVIFGGAHPFMRLVLPSLAILWAIMMAMIRSPILSLLGKLAFATQLPQAVSILTLVGGLVSAIRPLATNFIVGLGAPATFAIASITLLAGVAGLRKFMLDIPSPPEPAQTKSLSTYLGNLAIILLVGAAIGLGMRLLLGEILPYIFRTTVSPFFGISVEILIGGAFVVQAVLAVGAGAIANQVANKYLMIGGLGGIAACLGLLSLGGGAIASSFIILLLLACLGTVNNGTIPFALTMMPPSFAGLGVGTYFSGLSAAIAVWGFVISPKSDLFSMPNLILIAAIAWLMAGVGIAIGDQSSKN